MHKTVMTVALFVAGIPQAIAGATNAVALFPFSVPTIDEVGLLGLTIVLAVAGGIAARRRKRK